MSETQPIRSEVQQVPLLRDQYDPHQLRQVLIDRMNTQLPEGVNPPGPFKQFVIGSLYTGYELHRTMKTWGKPEVARQFFQTAWQSQNGLGLRDAITYAFQRASEDVGDPHKSPLLKTAAMILGSALLLTGIEKRMAESAGSNARNITAQLARGVGSVVLNATYGLLFLAKEKGGPAGSYEGATENTIPYYPGLVFPPTGDGYNEDIDGGNLDEFDTDLDRDR